MDEKQERWGWAWTGHKAGFPTHFVASNDSLHLAHPAA